MVLSDSQSVVFQPVDIWNARIRLKDLILRTPLLFSPAISRRTGCQIYLKMECWQLCGCFKVRGAMNMVSALSESERERGLVTCSSGNHGTALAYAASIFGRPSTKIFLPFTFTLTVTRWSSPVKGR
jgi:threonine dehydratase